ncbi:MAG: hypothetical protein JSS66_03670 [Armatimonadetes bacterium]|nr:hypothetical protein [Armatimonadota bacterium]
MSVVVAGRPTDAVLARLLEEHPLVVLSEPGSPPDTIVFEQEGRSRQLGVGYPLAEVHGLFEMVDNNPMVCATSVSLPTPAETLALIALGPAFLANIVVEDPVVQTNAPGCDPPDWTRAGWEGSVDFSHEDRDMGTVLAAQAMCVIEAQEDWGAIDDLYNEAFGRSFYVRRDEDSDWHADLVRGRPWAAYRLRLTADEPRALLTIQVMSDRNGKCGAAQMVHALNVMCGFEECLGIPGYLPG